MDSSILEKISTQLSNLDSISVLHDFFIDRIIKIYSKEVLIDQLNSKSKRGGGSFRGLPTIDIKGGNAVNVAYCLARLNAQVNLFTLADDFGTIILKKTFEKYSKNVNLIIKYGRQGYTTSLEFEENGGNSFNLMLSDIGDNNHFRPENLDVKDMSLLKRSSAIVLLNWASNLDSVSLCNHIFKSSKRSLRYIDPADIETRKEEFLAFIKTSNDFIDVLSINENECSSLLSCMNYSRLNTLTNEKEIGMVSKVLADDFGMEINIHTAIGSACSNGKEVYFSPSYRIKPSIFTGAGDVWDAANVIGYLVNLMPKERLDFANFLSSLYMQSTLGEPPDLIAINSNIE